MDAERAGEKIKKSTASWWLLIFLKPTVLKMKRKQKKKSCYKINCFLAIVKFSKSSYVKDEERAEKEMLLYNKQLPEDHANSSKAPWMQKAGKREWKNKILLKFNLNHPVQNFEEVVEENEESLQIVQNHPLCGKVEENTEKGMLS